MIKGVKGRGRGERRSTAIPKGKSGRLSKSPALIRPSLSAWRLTARIGWKSRTSSWNRHHERPPQRPQRLFLDRQTAGTGGVGWELAPRTLKHAYWKVFGMAAAKAKDADLAAGLDKDGNPLRPITERTRIERTHPHYSPMGQADPNAPVLTPCYSASRTRVLLR